MKMVVKKASDYKFRIVEILSDKFDWPGSFVVRPTDDGIIVEIYDDYIE